MLRFRQVTEVSGTKRDIWPHASASSISSWAWGIQWRNRSPGYRIPNIAKERASAPLRSCHQMPHVPYAAPLCSNDLKPYTCSLCSFAAEAALGILRRIISVDLPIPTPTLLAKKPYKRTSNGRTGASELWQHACICDHFLPSISGDVVAMSFSEPVLQEFLNGETPSLYESVVEA